MALLPSDLPDIAHDAEADALLDAHVERAVARYAGLLPEDALEAMRDELRFVLRTHPTARAYAKRLKPPVEVKQSADVAVGGGAAQLDAKRAGGDRD